MRFKMAKQPKKTIAPAPAKVPEPQRQTPAARDDGLLEVETTGSFMFIDSHTGAQISHEGTTRVPMSPFIQNKLESGELKKVG